MFSANIPRFVGHIILQFIIIQYIFIIWTKTLENLHTFIDELNDIHKLYNLQSIKQKPKIKNVTWE